MWYEVKKENGKSSQLTGVLTSSTSHAYHMTFSCWISCDPIIYLLLSAPPKGIKLCIFRDKLCIYICRWNTLKHMQKYRPKMGHKSGLTIWRIESTYTKLCYDKPNRYILWHQVPYVPTLTNILTYILILEAYCPLLFSGDKVYFWAMSIDTSEKHIQISLKNIITYKMVNWGLNNSDK